MQSTSPLQIIDVFSPPYKKWSRVELSMEEQLAHLKTHGFISNEKNGKLLKTISSATEAAEHMAENLADTPLENFIDAALSNNLAMHKLRNKMPISTPKALIDYQSRYPHYDHREVDQEINKYGTTLAEGQWLTHGGIWPSLFDEFITDRPLSTTFCPQIARRSAEWNGKAFDAGRIDFIVMRVTSPSTKAYLYSADGDLGHEKEIVFATGAKLTMLSETFICDTSVFQKTEKRVPAYVITATIS